MDYIKAIFGATLLLTFKWPILWIIIGLFAFGEVLEVIDRTAIWIKYNTGDRALVDTSWERSGNTVEYRLTNRSDLTVIGISAICSPFRTERTKGVRVDPGESIVRNDVLLDYIPTAAGNRCYISYNFR